MPRPRRPTSTQRSRARYGFCDDDEILPTTRHLTMMNKKAQMELAAYSDKHKLPYYDRIDVDDHGWLVTPSVPDCRTKRRRR
jgi:hypothetical protein